MVKQIKPNSLSHKFLSLLFSDSEIRGGINICDVPWRMLGCVAGVCAVVSFALTVIFIVLCMLSVLWMSFFDASWIPVDFIVTGVACYVLIVFGILLHWLGALLLWLLPNKDNPIKRSEIKEGREPKPPSLISIWWKSFKEKTCVKIIVADNVEEK